MAVRRMVADLDVGVEVVAVPIVRDVDGVALSSRNAYLDPEQRVRARALYLSLQAARRAAAGGACAGDVRGAAEAVLDGTPGLVVDYVALVDPDTASEVAADHCGTALLAVAARIGSTRLIDNGTIDLEDTGDAEVGCGDSGRRRPEEVEQNIWRAGGEEER
jgi:pantoate--beta-alanine ligase